MVHAAGLGQLKILSTLGQPLLAEVELVSVSKDESGSLTVRLASPEAFRSANIEYSSALIGMRMSIEHRAGGQPYVKVTSTRPMSEPFIDLLLDLTWSQGHLLRQYTVLIDPPNYAPAIIAAPVAPAVAAPAETAQPIQTIAPPAAPTAEVAAPVLESPPPSEAQPPAPEPAPEAAPPAPRAPMMSPPPKAAADEYKVKRGDTLFKVANEMKPDGVTTEQMLVSLFRGNPQAFEGKNMNRLRAGRILRVPGVDDITVTQSQAVKEIHVQAANWNAYRARLAESAGEAVAAQESSASSGKITTVEQPPAGQQAPKDVLKLSKGASAGAQSGDARLHALEEEATSKQKALDEANARVSELEKNIKDMQHLLELKGQAVPPAAPATPAEPAKPADAAKPAVTPPPAATDAVPPAATPVPPPVVATPPVAEAPKPAAKPRVVTPPPPPPEPTLMETLLGNPMYLGAIGLVLILLGVGGYVAMRRRGSSGGSAPARKAPRLGRKDKKAAAADAASAPVDPMSQTLAMPAVVPAAADEVDPIEEANLYLNFGRDAQAEEVLKEALEKNPQNHKAQLKLLQIYAGRKDVVEFQKVAQKLHDQTNGSGEDWIKAATLGYTIEPGNTLYAAGASAAPSAAGAGAVPGVDLDFDLDLSGGAGAGGAPTSTAVDLETGAGAALEKTMIFQPGELTQDVSREGNDVMDITNDSGLTRPTPIPDFTLNAPAATAPKPAALAPDITLDALPDHNRSTEITDVALDAGPLGGNMIDFSLDAPGSEPSHSDTVILQNPEALVTTPALDPEFKLDLGDKSSPALPDLKLDDINLNMGGAAPAAADGAGKDDRWFDVQTKFDLAKAYQEMGDKDGAREILQEVIKEGDAGQQAEAQALLSSL